MSLSRADLQSRLDEYDATTWDEDNPNYDPNRTSVSDTFSSLYYGELEKEVDGDYEYINFPPKPFDYELPGVGTLTVIDDYDDYDDGHALYVVFSIEGSTFQYTGWDDSWGGDGGWEGPLEKVETDQITITRYKVVP